MNNLMLRNVKILWYLLLSFNLVDNDIHGLFLIKSYCHMLKKDLFSEKVWKLLCNVSMNRAASVLKMLSTIYSVSISRGIVTKVLNLPMAQFSQTYSSSSEIFTVLFRVSSTIFGTWSQKMFIGRFSVLVTFPLAFQQEFVIPTILEITIKIFGHVKVLNMYFFCTFCSCSLSLWGQSAESSDK